MAPPRPPQRSTRARRRTALAASLLAHALVLGALGFEASTLIDRRPSPTPAHDVVLMRFAPEALAPIPSAPASRRRSPISEAVRRPGPHRRAQDAATGVPGRPASVPASTPSGAPSGAVAGLPASTAGALAEALRARLGCDLRAGVDLTPEERDRCNQRFALGAKQGPASIDVIPPEKRAYYDAVQAAYQAARDPAHPFIRGADGQVRAWGHPPGAGCGMRFGGPPPPPDHRSLTDKIKETGMLAVSVGPLKCGVMIPQGSLTPEVGVGVPAP